MPRPYSLGYAAISHEDRVHCRTEESLDQSRGAGIGADEVAEGPENCSFTEYSALLEQTRGCRSKANTFSLQPLERIQLGAQGSMEIFGPYQLFARGYFSFARLLQCLARILGELVRLGDPRRRDGRCIVCGGKLAARCFGRVEQVRPLALQPCATL